VTPLLEVQGLGKTFTGARGRQVRAVDGIGFHIRAGETLGLVGESGCGKSTTGRLVLRLIEPSQGTVHFDGADVLALRGRALRQWRRRAQIVFQDPFGSLDPRYRAGAIVAEPLHIHRIGSRAERAERAAELLRLVGVPPESLQRFPHEFSGGQRQRLSIARALALSPALVVCDEAVSALDVSVQAQIVNLLQDLKARLGLSYLFIAHDLSVVRHISDRVAVMYLGRIVELAPKHALFGEPRHPYTRALLAAAPRPQPGGPRAGRLSGDPAEAAPAQGCRFRLRCPLAIPRCAEEEPVLAAAAADHAVACHRPDV